MAASFLKDWSLATGKRAILDRIEKAASPTVIKVSNTAADAGGQITSGVTLGVLILAFLTMVGGALMSSGILMVAMSFTLIALAESSGDKVPQLATQSLLVIGLALVILPLLIGLLMVVLGPRIAGKTVSGQVRALGPNLLAAIFKG
jgi:hypothetical protein